MEPSEQDTIKSLLEETRPPQNSEKIRVLKRKCDYKYTYLPVLQDTVNLNQDEKRKTLLDLYKEINTNWRTLADIRFKLLGLLPTISIVAIIALFTGAGGHLTPFLQSIVSLLGFAVTIGIFMYDMRNSQLYDYLISRSRRIEFELGIHTGQHLGRPKARWFVIKHDVATGIIYIATIISWVVVILAVNPIFGWIAAFVAFVSIIVWIALLIIG